MTISELGQVCHFHQYFLCRFFSCFVSSGGQNLLFGGVAIAAQTEIRVCEIERQKLDFFELV